MLVRSLYRVTFKTPLGMGAGVAVLDDRQFHGGNSCYCFIGT